MRNKVFKHATPKPPNYKPRGLTPRDILRRAMAGQGALEYLPPLRKYPTDLERLLQATGIDEKLAAGLTFKEQSQLEADLSGLAAGAKAGTLPERLVAKWLLDEGYSYGGMGLNFNPTAGDWGFQVPLLGGRSAPGGTVADIFMTSQSSRTPKGRVIPVDGQYWHLKPVQAAKDAAIELKLKAKGFKVAHITDTEVLNGGLDNAMRAITSGLRDA